MLLAGRRAVNSAALTPEARLKRKEDKVRSAWISFIGRIVAQIVGAVASVSLGLMVLNKYHVQDKVPSGTVGTSGKSAVTSVSPEHLASHRARRASGELGLAVMPIQNFSKDAGHTYFADGVTEAL